MIETKTLARPYAKAAFAYAQQEKQLEEWSVFLMQLAEVVHHPQMVSLLHNPKITSEQLVQIMGACVKTTSDVLKNFLNVLSVHHRLNSLPAISTLFNEYKAQAEKKINVTVVSAFPLDESQKKTWIDLLAKQLQLQVELKNEIDKNIIGGAIIRAGDQVIDGSVRGRLIQLADTLLN
jgi:F-type H+-transporting ATPase subunit delta